MKSFRLRHKLISFVNDFDIRGIRKIAFYLPKLLIPKPKQSIIMTTLYGFKLKIDPVKDKGVELSIYNSGTYEKGTLFIIDSILKKGATFLDIGANIGLMSIFTSKVVGPNGKIIAFEPNPETRKILLENIQLNNISTIEVSPYAIGSKRETGKIYDRWDSNRGSASIVPSNENTGEGYDIEIISLKEYPFESNKIDLIKIDVEGFELEVLKGSADILSSLHPPMLIVECSSNRENTFGEDITALYNFIQQMNNYRFYKSKGTKERISKLIEIKSAENLPIHDNIYCFTNEHLKTIPKKLFK